jgi:hypothetical protein
MLFANLGAEKLEGMAWIRNRELHQQTSNLGKILVHAVDDGRDQIAAPLSLGDYSFLYHFGHESTVSRADIGIGLLNSAF